MSKFVLPCPSCGKKVIYEYLVPYYGEQSVIIANRKLEGYDYKCPVCKGVSFINADAVREAWQEDNPGVSLIRKL